MLTALSSCLQGRYDVRSIIVALQGIENILRVGEKYFLDKNGENLFANEVERCGGLDSLEEI